MLLAGFCSQGARLFTSEQVRQALQDGLAPLPQGPCGRAALEAGFAILTQACGRSGKPP